MAGREKERERERRLYQGLENEVSENRDHDAHRPIFDPISLLHFLSWLRYTVWLRMKMIIYAIENGERERSLH